MKQSTLCVASGKLHLVPMTTTLLTTTRDTSTCIQHTWKEDCSLNFCDCRLHSSWLAGWLAGGQNVSQDILESTRSRRTIVLTSPCHAQPHHSQRFSKARTTHVPTLVDHPHLLRQGAALVSMHWWTNSQRLAHLEVRIAVWRQGIACAIIFALCRLKMRSLVQVQQERTRVQRRR